MIFMAFALYCEARPFIEYLNLKKASEFEKFQLFRSDGSSFNMDVVLFISGTGSIHSTAVAAYVFAMFPPEPGDLFVNFGVCAGVSDRQKGKLYRINSIFEQATGRWFYPDLIFKTGNYEEASLVTVPVVAHTMDGQPCDLADMEGAALYQTAQLFFLQHQLLFFKVVFDIPDMEKQSSCGHDTARDVSDLCARQAPKLMNDLKLLYDAYLSEISSHHISFTDNEREIQNSFCKKIKATSQMERQLHQLLYYRKLKKDDVCRFLEDFCRNTDFSGCKSKKEGIAWLNKLRESLWM